MDVVNHSLLNDGMEISNQKITDNFSKIEDELDKNNFVEKSQV